MKPDASWHALWEGWRRRVETLVREHPLQLISWEATRRCNLRCIHCGSPSEEVKLDDELTADEVVGAFEQIATDFDMRQFHHVNITGGEPFVRHDLLGILRQISRRPVYSNIDIQTNGIVLADCPEILDELKKCGVTGLGISIDGMETTHDAFRRMPGGFTKAFKAARLAVDKGYTVTVSIVAHARNVTEIPALFDLVKKEIRPRNFRVMTLDAAGRAEHLAGYSLSPEQLRQAIEFLRAEYARSCSTYADPQATMVELGCGGWMGTELEGMIRPLVFHCIAGLNNLGILFDGKLASCSNVSREFIEGDLRKERIKTVWENRYIRFRDFEWKRIGECTACDQWDFCHGGPMHKRQGSGEMQECLLWQYRRAACG